MNDDLAKSILQAILARAGGQVGNFVDLRELATQSPFRNADTNTTIDELFARRWMDRKGDCVSVSKSGVEYAIDWNLADEVLKSIAIVANSQGGRVVLYNQVTAMISLPTDKTDELMAELAILGLAATTASDGKRIDGAYISREGLARIAGSPNVA